MSIIKVPWTQQPKVPVGIDWSNPISRGLVSASNPAVGCDLVRNVPVRSHVISPSSLGINAIENTFWLPINFDSNYVRVPANTSFTIVVAVPKTVLTGNNPGVMRSGSYGVYGGPSGSTFTIIRGTNFLPWVRINGSEVFKPSSGAALAVGSEYILAFSITSSSSVKVAWNGTVRHSGSHSRAVAQFDIYGLGAQSAPTETIGGLSGALIFLRAMSDSELQWITQRNNFWQIFKPLSRPIFVGYTEPPTLNEDITINLSTSNALAEGNIILLDKSLYHSVANALAEGIFANFSTGQIVNCLVGNSISQGITTLLDRNIPLNVSNAVAAGQVFIEDINIPLGVSNSIATGTSLKIDRNISLNVSNSIATGIKSNIDKNLLLSVSNAIASGQIYTEDISLYCQVADSIATGTAFGSGNTIGCLVGNALASGQNFTISLNIKIDTNSSNAISSGYTGHIDINYVINYANASAIGTPYTKDFSINCIESSVIAQGVNFKLDKQLNSNLANSIASGISTKIDISTKLSVANAIASGIADILDNNIGLLVGNASATGQVYTEEINIHCNIVNITASGVLCNISFVALNYIPSEFSIFIPVHETDIKLAEHVTVLNSSINRTNVLPSPNRTNNLVPDN